MSMVSQAKEAKLGVCFFLLASGAILLTRLDDGVALLWVANAPLIAFLCRRSSARHWWSAVAWTLPASIAASTLFGPVAWAAPLFGSASIVEATLAALLLRRWLGTCDYFGSVRSITIFCAAAGIVAPMTSGIIGATAAFFAFGRPWTDTFVDWVVGRGLGTLIASPIVLLLIDNERKEWTRRLLSQLWGEGGMLLAVVAIVTAGVFWQEQLPLLFLPALPILLATFKLGRPGASMSILIVALIGGVATASGHGPVMISDLSRVEQLQFFQLYLAATFLMALPVAGALEQREQLVRALGESEARHRRIVDRSQDIIFETDAAGRWTFLSEAWTRISGRDVDGSLGQRALAAVMHEDRPALMAALADAHRGNDAVGQTEVRFMTETGVRWAGLSLRLLRGEAGRMAGAYGTIIDITERRRSEEKVVESERRYRTLADNTTDMIAQIGPDDRYCSVTPASQRLLGIAPGELIGTSFIEGVTSEHRHQVLQALAALRGGVRDHSLSYQQLRRGGDPVWVEAAFRLLSDGEGPSGGVIASIRDISSRKIMEAQTAAALARVRENNRLFGMAGSLASIGHWRFNLNTDDLVWSDEIFRIHGLEVGVPPTLSKAMSYYHPDDRMRVQAILNQAIADRREFEFAARFIQDNGTIRHVLAQGQVELDEAGSTIGMFGVFQDVTERTIAAETLRDSEARFRLITEQASDMIALIDLEGVCLFISPASTTILGVPPSEMIGTKLIHRIHEDDQAAVNQYRVGLHSGTVSTGGSHRFRMRNAGGEYAWLEASSRRAAIGDAPCIVTVWRDVSSQVAIEAELKSAKMDAEAASVAKAGFLANMSHEIRTPMNGVIGFAELLLTSDLTEQQRRDAGLIADSGRAMMTLLNDILDLSKIESGQLDVVSEPFDLRHTLRACGKLLEPSAVRKELGFSLKIADDVPRMMVGDALRLRQIVLNLLGNAIKFTERGEIGLKVRVADVDGRQRLLIVVSDTGIGIAAERQGSIFEEFVQADHSITRRYGGSGLGLAISNRLAGLLGGNIDLLSCPGLGTVVTLQLPAIVAAEQLTPVKSSTVVPTRLADRPARVLLAEDHEVNQLLVRAMLAKGGHDVTVAVDGQQAVEEVHRSMAIGVPFDIVLMDMQMPVMDGLAATRAIRSAEKKGSRRLPIVALTANAFSSDFDDCRAAGMDDHLAKPVSMESLLSVVERWLHTADTPTQAVVATTEVAAALSLPAPTTFRPSAKVQAKYAEQRARTLEHVDALIRRGTFAEDEIREAAGLLHKLAGTAGMFGESALGDRASEMEDGLLAWPVTERATRVPAAARTLRDAA